MVVGDDKLCSGYSKSSCKNFPWVNNACVKAAYKDDFFPDKHVLCREKHGHEVLFFEVRKVKLSNSCSISACAKLDSIGCGACSKPSSQFKACCYLAGFGSPYPQLPRDCCNINTRKFSKGMLCKDALGQSYRILMPCAIPQDDCQKLSSA